MPPAGGDRSHAIRRSVFLVRGPLETRYLEVHPGATTGLDACRYLQRHAGRWFTHAELKSALGCSDRIIREHLPEALNSGEPALLDVDRSQRAWRYRYPGIHT
jgi:hypothetical protein